MGGFGHGLGKAEGGGTEGAKGSADGFEGGGGGVELGGEFFGSGGGVFEEAGGEGSGGFVDGGLQGGEGDGGGVAGFAKFADFVDEEIIELSGLGGAFDVFVGDAEDFGEGGVGPDGAGEDGPHFLGELFDGDVGVGHGVGELADEVDVLLNAEACALTGSEGGEEAAGEILEAAGGFGFQGDELLHRFGRFVFGGGFVEALKLADDFPDGDLAVAHDLVELEAASDDGPEAGGSADGGEAYV